MPSRYLSQDVSSYLQIVPGFTKHLLISLAGDTGKIQYDFQADEQVHSLFKISVAVDEKIISNSTYNFTEVQAFQLELDYHDEQCTISGDKGFSLISGIHDEHYEISISRDDFPSHEQIYILMRPRHRNHYIAIIVGIIAAVGVLALMVGVAFCILSRKRSSLHNKAPENVETVEAFGKRVDSETVCNSKVVSHVYHEDIKKVEQGCCYNQNTLSLNEVKAGLDLKNFKKESNRSQASTIPSFTRGNSQHFGKIPSGSNLKFLCDDLENICDDSNDTKIGNKMKSLPSLPSLPSNYVDKLKKPTPAGKALTKSQTNFELKPPVDCQPNAGILSLDMVDSDDDNDDKDARRMPTLSEIKALVQKMEAEGTLGLGCNSSEESSNDEEQYEAPMLPNYTCCMLCFEGKRCTIAQPCRHIFSCHDCIEDLLQTYKICVICANGITGYEDL